jgi:glycosyltransferase involved in cell wall biosynthesis
VVASDAPVIDTRIRDGETGLLFPAEDAEVLAAKVLFFCNNHDLAKRLVENGHRQVQELTADKYLARLREVYLSLG